MQMARMHSMVNSHRSRVYCNVNILKMEIKATYTTDQHAIYIISMIFYVIAVAVKMAELTISWITVESCGADITESLSSLLLVSTVFTE